MHLSFGHPIADRVVQDYPLTPPSQDNGKMLQYKT